MSGGCSYGARKPDTGTPAADSENDSHCLAAVISCPESDITEGPGRGRPGRARVRRAESAVCLAGYVRACTPEHMNRPACVSVSVSVLTGRWRRVGQRATAPGGPPTTSPQCVSARLGTSACERERVCVCFHVRVRAHFIRACACACMRAHWVLAYVRACVRVRVHTRERLSRLFYVCVCVRVRDCAYRRRLGAGRGVSSRSVSAHASASASVVACASACACAGDCSQQLYQTTTVWEQRPRPHHKGAPSPKPARCRGAGWAF